MAARNSALWVSGHGPDRYVQGLSLLINEYPEIAEAIVDEIAETAAERMRDIIQDGGFNKTQKGGPRILSEKMIDSVGFASAKQKAHKTRMRADFGFINNAPAWTNYQENGTRNIAPMWAYVTAALEAKERFADAVQDLGQEIETRWDRI